MTTLDELMAEPQAGQEMARRKGMVTEPKPGEEYVDRFEGDIAVLMKDSPGGTTTRDVPRSALPRGTKEGDLIPSAPVGDSSLYGMADVSGAGAQVINSLYGSRFK